MAIKHLKCGKSKLKCAVNGKCIPDFQGLAQKRECKLHHRQFCYADYNRNKANLSWVRICISVWVGTCGWRCKGDQKLTRNHSRKRKRRKARLSSSHSYEASFPFTSSIRSRSSPCVHPHSHRHAHLFWYIINKSRFVFFPPKKPWLGRQSLWHGIIVSKQKSKFNLKPLFVHSSRAWQSITSW